MWADAVAQSKNAVANANVLCTHEGSVRVCQRHSVEIFAYFFRFEVEHLLARAGFRLIDTFGDYDRSTLDDESPEMLFVAQKIEPAQSRLLC